MESTRTRSAGHRRQGEPLVTELILSHLCSGMETTREISLAMDMKLSTISVVMWRLHQHGRVMRVGSGSSEGPGRPCIRYRVRT